MVTASSIAARASSRRPRSDSRLVSLPGNRARPPSSPPPTDWLFSDVARSGKEGAGAGAGQLAADGDGFLDRGQGLFPPPQARQPVRLVVQRHGQVGEESVGAGAGQLAVGGDGFLDRGQGLFPPPQVRQPVRLVVQRRGEVGEESVGAGAGQLPADGDGFLDRGQGLFPPPQVRQPVDWLFSDVARSGRKAPGRARASSRRMVTASSIAARASSRRPRSDSRTTGCSATWPGRGGRRRGGRGPAPGRR